MSLTGTASFLKALAHDSRLRLVIILLDGPRCVEELAERLGLAPSTISHHLKVLAGAGLVTSEPVQYYTEYQLVDRLLDCNLRDLVEQADVDRDAGDRREARAAQAVLRAHVKEGRIVRLPQGLRKRKIILEALAADLDPGRPYDRDQLHLLLGRRHADPDLLRRELLAWGFLVEEAGRLTRAGNTADLRLPPLKSTPPPPAVAVAPGALVGVGWIRHRESGRVFLLGSHHLQLAFNRQRARLAAGNHRCAALQADWERHGPDQFEVEILETVPAERADELGRLEQGWLAGMQPLDEHCYNEGPMIRDDGDEAGSAG